MSASIFSAPAPVARTAPPGSLHERPPLPDMRALGQPAPRAALGALGALPVAAAAGGHPTARAHVKALIEHLLKQADFACDPGWLKNLGQALGRECGKPAGQAFAGPPPEALQAQMAQTLKQMQQMIQALHLMCGSDRVPCAQACQACCGGGGCGGCCSASAWNAACNCAGGAQCGASCWSAFGTACGCCGNSCAQGWGRAC